MGSVIQRKAEPLRALYNPTEGAQSNYDLIYGDTIFDHVFESLEAGAVSLTTKLDMMKMDLESAVSGKQNTIAAGSSNNIMAFSGITGQVSSLERATAVVAGTASDIRIPTEKAVVDYTTSAIANGTAELSETVNTRMTTAENNITTHSTAINRNTTAISTIEGELLNTNNTILQLNSSIGTITTDVNGLKTTTAGWAATLLNPTYTGSVQNLGARMADLELNALDASDFGDGTYTRKISVANVDSIITISNTVGHLDGSPDSASSTVIGSSDGSVLLSLTQVGAASSIDIKSPVTTAALDLKLDANTPIVPGTAIKVTFDAKGLITDTDDLEAADIPILPLTGISDGTDTLDILLTSKATTLDVEAIDDRLEVAEAAIEGQSSINTQFQDAIDELVATKVTALANPTTEGTFSKVTVNADGLVTEGLDLTLADITDLSTLKAAVQSYVASYVDVLTQALIGKTVIESSDVDFSGVSPIA